MKRYAPNALELASRDVVSRSETTEIEAGARPERLGDARPPPPRPGEDPHKLPGSRELAMTYAGVDPICAPIPVRPGAHYHMGGVETDEWGLTELEGLYAAGEAACVSVHGANRLGGNSLMETITFGRRSVATRRNTRSAAPSRSNGHAEARAPTPRLDQGLSPWRRASATGRSATSSASRCSRTSGLPLPGPDGEPDRPDLRAPAPLRAWGRGIEDKGAVFQRPDPGDRAGLPARPGLVHAPGRPARQESRGAHSRPSDFPERDDEEVPSALHHALGRRRAAGSTTRRAQTREPMVKSY